jgi:hypothetical protein
MANDEFDRREVDRLVRELSEPPKPPEPAPAQPAAERAVRHVSRWTTARILMPATRSAEPRRTLASMLNLPKLPALAALGLPNLPAPRLPNLPALSLPALAEATSPAVIVRAWVTLGILLSVSLPYWPYPKTYLLGMLAYIFAVALLVVAGVWSAKLTWEVRLGGAHTISLGIVLWAIVLVAADTLPLVNGS